MHPRPQVVDRELGQHVEGAREHRLVTLDGCHQPPVEGLEAQTAARRPREKAAFDRPLDAAPRDGGRSQADHLERAEAHRIAPAAREAEGEALNVRPEGIAKSSAADSVGHRNRVIDRNRPARPAH